MSSETLSREEAISQFCGVTGADEERAKGLLEACDWNLELAINMHVDTDDGRGNKPSTSNSVAGPSTSAAVPEVAPIVTIDDSIEEEAHTMAPEGHRPSHRYPYRDRQTARKSTGPNRPEFDVRPPIPPIRQVLVQNPGGYSSELNQRRYNTRTGGISDVYDAFRDFQAEAQWQEMAQEAGETSTSESSTSNANKRRTLQDLFRPPLEIMFRGSLSSAREVGELQNKWLLVNIQNGREFACQILNRDVWSNQAVKDILKEQFIFWQVYHDSFEGSRYIQFYNVESFPHVSIIDPRTGEQMKSWPVTIDHNSFCDSVIEFLTEHPSPDGATSDANTMKKLRVKEEDAARTLYDQSEEAQLEAAIKASLQENENSNSSRAFIDEDSYLETLGSDTDQTSSSFQAQTSSSSSSAFAKVNENRINNGTVMASSTFAVRSDPCDPGKIQASPKLGEPSQPKVTAAKDEIEDYKKYLGNDTEKFSDLVVRFPDGTRDQFKFPSDSTMKALFLLLTTRGYGRNLYNYVTNFPRRLLHELPSTDTLQDAKLIRETIFVERRVNEDPQLKKD